MLKGEKDQASSERRRDASASAAIDASAAIEFAAFSDRKDVTDCISTCWIGLL